MVQGPTSSLPPSVRPSPTPSQVELSKVGSQGYADHSRLTVWRMLDHEAAPLLPARQLIAWSAYLSSCFWSQDGVSMVHKH